MTYTIQQFAEVQNVSERHMRRLIANDKLPEGYKLFQKNKKERYIVKVKEEIKYKNPKELTANEILEINKCLNDKSFYKRSGEANIKKIAEATGQHYWTIYRFIKKEYKPKNKKRADKGKSRVLTEEQIKKARNAFEILFLRNAQGNVRLTIEKVEWNTGIKIPQRMAYRWAKEFKAVHEQHHYYPSFMNKRTTHTVRDLWAEYPNMLDCVVADEWKVDEFGVWIPSNTKGYDDIVATAYIVMFQDMKTRYPLSVLMTPHSTTTADTKRAAMELVRKYGRPKQWIFENAKTWKNENFLQFIMGLYADDETMQGYSNIEFMNLDDLKIVEHETNIIIRSGVRHPQSKPVERTFRIFKDEYTAYLQSYSPNIKESRKPTMRDSHPGVTRTYEELRRTFTHFLDNEFINRKRTMFHNRMLSPAHPVNKARPKTIKEAFDLAYQTFTPDKVEPLRLAYLYADKYRATFSHGELSFVNKLSMEKMHFVPEDFEAAYTHMDERLVVLLDQYNQYHAWIFTEDGQLICEARDERAIAPQSREQSNIIGKAKRRYTASVKTKKKALKELAEAEGIVAFEYERTMEDPVPSNPIDNYETEEMESYQATVEDDEDYGFDDDSLIDYNPKQ